MDYTKICNYEHFPLYGIKYVCIDEVLLYVIDLIASNKAWISIEFSSRPFKTQTLNNAILYMELASMHVTRSSFEFFSVLFTAQSLKVIS